MANSTEGMNWKAGITSYQLKWIAIETMVIDHMGAILYPTEMVFRYIGRVSFPIFCFLLVEGFCHTHDIFGYMARLGAFALMSEIPYDLAFNGEVLEFTHQNVFFTLLLGVILMYVLEKGGEWPQKAVEVLLVMWMAVFFHTDYGYRGILLIFIFYQLRRFRWAKLGCGAAWNLIWNRSIQGYGAFAMIPIALYNGSRGKKMKYFFYIFYPAHLLILFVISRYIG